VGTVPTIAPTGWTGFAGITVPCEIHAAPLTGVAAATLGVAGAARAGVTGVVLTTVTPLGASAKAALGAAPHRLTIIIAAAVTAPRKFKDCI
jgi:hypothetical protein